MSRMEAGLLFEMLNEEVILPDGGRETLKLWASIGKVQRITAIRGRAPSPVWFMQHTEPHK